MSIFEVNNDIELGNAIWSSQQGDTIILKSGEYGNIPLKNGVSYRFEDESTAAGILGLGVGNEEWSAGSIQVGNISITNPRIQKTNIKLYYIFQKKLPFNSRMEPNTYFVHANGVRISVVGNDKGSFSLGGLGGAEEKLPKGVVNIIVPSLSGFDLNKSEDVYLDSLFSQSISDDERYRELKIHKEKKDKRRAAEKYKFNESIELPLNEFEYMALWALNSFIREYARITNERKIQGFSISTFRDELLTTITSSLDEDYQFTPQQYVDNFINSKISDEQVSRLSTAFLSSQEFSISEFSSYHLAYLNYPIATVGIYQEFEVMWEASPQAKMNKWNFIEAHTSDIDIKSYLAEMINARNNIVHSKTLFTSHSSNNRLKDDWGARTLNEYEIFAYKAPWYWMKSLSKFKAAYNNQRQPTAGSGC